MVKSNVVTITVESREGRVDSNSLSVDKTSGYVGDTFHFTGTVKGWIPDTSWYVWIKIYVNDSFYKDISVYPPSGDFTQNYEFDLSFDSAGSYSIYTVAVPQQMAEKYGVRLSGVKSNVIGLTVAGVPVTPPGWPEWLPWWVLPLGVGVVGVAVVGGVIAYQEHERTMMLLAR